MSPGDAVLGGAAGRASEGPGLARPLRAAVAARIAALRRWASRSLARRFLVMSLGLLLVIQAASFLMIEASLHRHAYAAMPGHLDMGGRTLQSLLNWRTEKFVEGARLLAADYGFRAAVLSNDRETISSVLVNHGARIGAAEVALLDTRLVTVALSDDAGGTAQATAAAAARLAPEAARTGGASEIAVIDGLPRQVVLVPMKAPVLVGWVLVTFALPQTLADTILALSGTELTLLSRGSVAEPWRVGLSRLAPADAATLASAGWDDGPTAPMRDLVLGDHEIVARSLRLAPAAGGNASAAAVPPLVLALLTVSVDEALRPPRDLQVALAVTTLLGFVAFGIGSAWAARRITTPLQSLAAAAERLGSGDSATPIIQATSHDEVGELSQAFEQMRINVATKQEQIVQSEKLASIGQLAAGVAHEINNPIGFVFSNFGSLEGYLAKLFRMLDAYREEERGLAGTPAEQRLKRLRKEIELEYLQEDIPALMSESKDGIRRVRKIVQDLKDFSHVDAREEWQAADLHAGLDSTLNIVSNEIKYRANLIKVYGPLPEVECLPGELNQVFMNLLVNAGHAVGDKPGEQRGTITLSTGVQGAEVWVEVADTGSGIAPADMKRIFDPFFTTKAVGKGTGLGLSLSYGIVKKHGGRIDVESEQGSGTRFRVWLPIRRPAAAMAPEAKHLELSVARV